MLEFVVLSKFDEATLHRTQVNTTLNIGNDSPELASAPANSPGVSVPTRGEKEAVRVPSSGGTPERSLPEPEVSQNR